ncbi:MAG: translation initiation factor IF-2 [Acidobacteria bacterium]|nr:MAG: translation initiation factor IF-2 [Acidobacteriota bacterium]
MDTTRINDLARELEVKSRVILDALTAIGFTEKKTHSSNIENDVADRVRRHLRGEDVAPVAAAPAAAKPAAKTKAQEPVAAEIPAVPEPAAQPPAKPEARAPGLRKAPAAASPATVTPAKPKLPIAPERPVYHVPVPAAPAPPVTAKPEPPPSRTPAAPEAPRRPPVFKPFVPAAGPSPAARATPQPAAPSPVRPTVRRPQLNISQTPNRPTGAGQIDMGARRVIVPIAPKRPIYTAPDRPVVRTTPGRPIVPAPGRPIYQRTPVGAPRPGVVPEGRRPMHPTRPAQGRGAPPRGAQHGHGRRERQKEGAQNFQPAARATAPVAAVTNITISEGLTVKDLSERLGLRAKDVIRKLLDRGLLVTVNQSLDTEIATQIAKDFGATAETVSFEQEALGAIEPVDAGAGEAAPSETLVSRAPVVTIMGHVDHGKTSLLDAIRQTSVASGEAGGITQHIGAYKVEVTDPNSPAFGRKVVFIDTPGHAAFTRMRAGGAKVTDIVVLVVAADDGVMPQTIEAIDHARAANVPIVVAVNKIDKPGAQPDRVKKQLGERGLLAEDWGGSTVTVSVSAKAKTNLNLLLEMILLVSDLQELKADPERPGQGVVLEAQLDRGRGPVARVLVQNGSLHTGDTLIAGAVMGRIRAMFDDRGRAIEEAGPSTPAEVLGLDGLPDAGENWLVVNDRNKARQIVMFREEKAREATLARSTRLNLEALSQQLARGDVKELNLIIKADVQGSEEVLVDAVNKLSTDKVKVRVIHSGVGAITESDVLLASASHAVVIGFNVRPERKAIELAEQENVDIRLHTIIYELTDEIQRAMHGLLEPTFKESTLGHAEVQQTFRIPKVGTVAGCLVKDGKLVRDGQVRVIRDGAVVYTGKLTSLRRFKEDAGEVRAGMECGASVGNFNDIKQGDVLEAFTIEKVAPLLS